MPNEPHRYSDAEIQALWRTLRERRDMRHFVPVAEAEPLPEGLIERLRKVLSVNGKEYKLIQRDREELQTLHCKMAIEIDQCNQIIANHSKLMQAQDVVIEQSRDNVKLALVLAASPEISGDAVDYLARLVRKDEQDQKAKIDKLMNDRYVVDMPF